MARDPRPPIVDSHGATLLRTGQGQTLLRGIDREPTADASQLLGTSPRYRLDRCLGGGTFGAVYQATTLDAGETASPKRVAIKVLHGNLPNAQRAHVLKRELSSLRAISCPRIPTVFYADVSSDPPYLVMELFPHGTLEDMVSHHGPLSPVNATSLLVSLLEAAHAAHQADVLHLDIKPANVLLDGAGGFVLTDFGIS